MLFEDFREPLEARKHYEKSGENYRLLNHNRDAANCFRTVALIHIDLEEYDQARIWLENSIELERIAGNKLGLRISFINLALVNEELKNFSAAKELAEKAIKIDQELGLSNIEKDYRIYNRICQNINNNEVQDIKMSNKNRDVE
jgi:tetratricopeptide (TPR) repeat protein